MAKILDFRNKGGGCSPSDFLTDGNETLSFDTRQGGMFRLGGMSKSSPFPDLKKDWTNQELADLYRVHRLLSGANVPVETDRGITDEGDPWFVFCHASGEVFIHLCRIDGIYLLDSPNVLRPLRGADFRALIADFSNQSLPATGAAEESTHRVIRLERGGKIRLHPSAMLAALIWTLFMASEDLVMLAPDAQSGDRVTDDDGLLNFDGVFAAHSTDPLIEGDMTDAGQDHAVIHTKDSGTDTLHLTSDAPVQMREVALSQQGLTAHQNGFTIGLSSIAIAMGFMSEVLLLDDQRKVLDSLNKLGFSEYGRHDTAAVDAGLADDDDGSALMVMLQKFLGIDLAFDTEFSETETPDAKPSLLQQELKHLDDDALTSNTAQPLGKQTPLPPLQDKIAEADAAAKLSEGAVQQASADPATAKAETAATLTAADGTTAKSDVTVLSLSEDIRAWQTSQLEEFQLGKTVIKASFDLSDVYTLTLLPETVETEAEAREFRVTNLYEYEGLAQRLVDFFTNKGSALGFIEQDNGFIAVDREAVKGGDAEYIQWETHDGKSISVIGLPSDFQHFDMIA